MQKQTYVIELATSYVTFPSYWTGEHWSSDWHMARHYGTREKAEAASGLLVDGPHRVNYVTYGHVE
jgi:hypothetical protein